ncbi:Wadjet anti-phage system protein JetD domain-containing protein [Massilia sp. W12]|uniref:Wadjet anti-phage system protein JetD domain-containing protein n=1 Tax=Massilia sp. W12 TaxID=3126507 RepID=UPI0030D23CF1
MRWRSQADFKQELAQLWQRGEILRAAHPGQNLFPLRLKLSRPSAGEISADFAAVRAWVEEFKQAAPFRVVWGQTTHRLYGAQQLPQEVWMDEAQAAAQCLGKMREWKLYAELLKHTAASCPALLSWLAKRPMQALELAPEWPQLLAVVQWRLAHPGRKILLRQIDAPGVHSKLIEAQRAVLAELFDLALPQEQIDTRYSGVAGFCARYGFADKPLRIRLRSLDSDWAIWPGANCPDLTIDVAHFSRLAPPLDKVLITENESNFLALPHMPGCLAIFGAGYGWEALAQADWLQQRQLYYWGDIDTHGFAILDQLRAHFPHAVSIMMDEATLLAHRQHWGREDKPRQAQLMRLRNAEQLLYQDLCSNRFAPQLRLEQERLEYGLVCARLAEVLASWPSTPRHTFPGSGNRQG